MEYKKNSTITLKIDDLGNNGEGIGHIDGYAFFVKGVLPGEEISAKVLKANKSYGFAKCIEIIKEAKEDRAQPICPVYNKCGGCDLQHMNYDRQLKYKENKVAQALRKIGGVDIANVDFKPIVGIDGAPWNYRNKATFVMGFSENEGKVSAGFYAPRTHALAKLESCHTQLPVINNVLKEIVNWANDNQVKVYDEKKPRAGILRHAYIRTGYATGDIMVCLVVRENVLSNKQRENLVDRLKSVDGMKSILLNINPKPTNVIMGKKIVKLWGDSYIEDKIGDVIYRISPHSFYQVNPFQTAKLYDIAVDFMELEGNENVLDLFCGIGTISLYVAGKLSKGGKVYGVEIVEDAVNDAKLNAQINNMSNADFLCMPAEKLGANEIEETFEKMSGNSGGKSSDGQESTSRSDKVDIVVVDPPRKGCDAALLDTITELKPKKIVYVSCDPATLARDVKILEEKGYALRKVRPCDMFPQSHHVECVVQLSRA